MTRGANKTEPGNAPTALAAVPPPRRRNLGALAALLAMNAILAPIAYLSMNTAKPPPIQIGSDTCASCDMTIEDARFAASRWIRQVAGQSPKRSILLYDDLGCMLDADRANEGGEVFRRYVQDSQGTGWIDAERAWYTMDTKNNRTPMSSGILAFRKKPAVGGLTLAEVAAKRHAFMKAKYGGE